MTTSVSQTVSAITLTQTAMQAGYNAGTNLEGLIGVLQDHVTEVHILLNQILAIHPSTGADATNYTTLQGLLTTVG